MAHPKWENWGEFIIEIFNKDVYRIKGETTKIKQDPRTSNNWEPLLPLARWGRRGSACGLPWRGPPNRRCGLLCNTQLISSRRNWGINNLSSLSSYPLPAFFSVSEPNLETEGKAVKVAIRSASWEHWVLWRRVERGSWRTIEKHSAQMLSSAVTRPRAYLCYET